MTQAIDLLNDLLSAPKSQPLIMQIGGLVYNSPEIRQALMRESGGKRGFMGSGTGGEVGGQER